MGMYDYIKCKYPLPDHPELQDDLFQSKETPNQFLETYVITKDGRLLWEEVRYEDRSDPDTGNFIGCCTPVPTGRMIDQEYDGLLWMCTSRGYSGGDDYQFYDYRVEFRNGQLVVIERVSGN